jgi:uncharacterized protein
VRALALLLCGLPGVVVCTSLACTPPTPGAHTVGPLPGEPEGGPSSSIADAGAMKVCTHDAKDLAPCTEDCDRGLASACSVAALRVEHGDGVPKDLTRAVRLHERACELRDAAACVSAARMHAAGAGVPPSRARQIELLDQACALGDGAACSVAAKAFANGTGVARDERRARELRERACASGVETACEEIESPP